jgi:hypothetical protein
MKSPPDTTFHEDVSLLVWRPHGIVNEAAVTQIVGYIGDLEARRKKPFNRCTDTQSAEAIDLNFRYIFHVSLYRRLSCRGPPINSAVLVTDVTKDRYAKMHQILTQGSPIKVRLFEDREEAAKWLNVPLELIDSPK